MIDLKLDRSSEISFKITIEGSDKEPESFFTLSLNEDFNLMLKGTIEKDHVIIHVPALQPFSHLFKEAIVPCSLSVLVDKNYFIPWKSNATIIKPVQVFTEDVVQEYQKTQESETKISIELETAMEVNNNKILYEDFSDIEHKEDE